MDQIWLASPSPALRLWPGAAGATWRLNPAAASWARSRQLNEATWRGVAAALSAAHATGPEREGRLADLPLRWRSLPLSTGWLVWLIPDPEPVAVASETEASHSAEAGRPAADPAGVAGCEQQGIERSAPRIDLVADAAGAGLWLLDLNTGCAQWSRQMFMLHGLPEDAAAPAFDAYADECVHPADRAVLQARLSEALQSEAQRFDTEFRIVLPDGSERWVEYRSRRERQEGRDLIVGVAIDATERMAQRVETERARNEQGAQDRTGDVRSEFLARMSHELRTPLNAVLGFAQLIEHDGASVPMAVQLERVVRIREAGDQLLRLIGDVLEHLKRETPSDVPDTVPASLHGDGIDIETVERALSVLYIEDNPVNVILVEELVAMRPNTHLRCAVTGLSGVALAAAGAPDVVLVDMQLPDIDGFEVLRRLRGNRSLDQSAVIALSANGMGDDIALALAAGFDDYWTKPIDFRHFLNGLDALARAR